MNKLYLLLAVVVMCGCGKVHAQGETNDTGVSFGTASSTWVYEGGACTIIGCEVDDGKPPRIVQYYDPPLDAGQKAIYLKSGSTGCDLPAPENSICIYGQPHKIIFRWVCDKGYELSGAEITWPDGIAKISPTRCAPKGKP